MKKLMGVALSVMLMVVLVACGVPQEKLDTARAKYDELVALCDRAQTAVEELETLTTNAGMPMDGTFDTFFTELVSVREEYAASIEGLDKMKEAEVDALIASLTSELEEGTPVVEILEKMKPEFETMMTTLTNIQTDMQAAVDAASQVASPSAELQDMYASLEDNAMSMQDDMMALLDNVDQDDPQAMFEAFQSVNTMLTDFHNQILEMKTLAESEMG